MADTNTPPPADTKEDVPLDENGQVNVRKRMPPPLPRGPGTVPRCFVCVGHDSEQRARRAVLRAVRDRSAAANQRATQRPRVLCGPAARRKPRWSGAGGRGAGESAVCTLHTI